MLPFTSRAAIVRILLFLVFLGIVAWWFMVRMPGKSARAGEKPGLTTAEIALREELRADVQKLAGEIGQRNLETYLSLQATANFIEHSLGKTGFVPHRQGYEVQGKLCENIEIEIPGSGQEVVAVGAHYDTVPKCPGANDNSSGVAALLALACRAPRHPACTLRFVAFVNEEPGYFQTNEMGSVVIRESLQGARRSNQGNDQPGNHRRLLGFARFTKISDARLGRSLSYTRKLHRLCRQYFFSSTR